MKPESWFGLYRLLKGIGFPQPQVPVTLPGKTTELSIGWPDLEIALTTGPEESDAARRFERAGWIVMAVPTASLESSGPLLAFLDNLARSKLIAKSEREAKMDVSKTERKVLEALLAAGLPEPNRNVEFRDASGRTITVPDFAWTDVKLAVYVDGHWYHGGKDLDDSLKAAVTEDPELASEITARAKATAARDAAKRRAITSQGWTVMAVSDIEVDAGHLDEIVADIKATWERLQAQNVSETGAG